MYFPYSRTNGILRYLISNSKKSNTAPFTVFATSENGAHYKSYAFDFNPSTYWTSTSTLYSPQYLVICFNQIFAKLESFEISTPNTDCRPKNFDVDVSKDGINYFNNQRYNITMSRSEIRNFNYKTNKYIKCFRHKITEKSTCGYLEHDIVQYEFFGYP